MSNLSQDTKPTFSVQGFAPLWGAAVMGTGVISVIFMAIARLGIAESTMKLAAAIFLAITILVATPILGITSLRWLRHQKEVKADLNHPVKGAMYATFAGGFLVLAAAFSRVAPEYLAEKPTFWVTLILTIIGASLALCIGFIFLSGSFTRGDVPKEMITGAWFIPPVVTIIVPTALAPLLREQNTLNNELLWISWAFLGVGTMLYMAIVATLFYRKATAKLPPAPLAPTLLIGMGPAGLIGLDLILLAEATERLFPAAHGLRALAVPLSTMTWGFGLWWAIATLFILRRGYSKLPFTLSWWGFTFPLGAWVVAGLATASVSGSHFVLYTSLLGAIVMLVLWFYVSFKTLKAIRSGTAWAA